MRLKIQTLFFAFLGLMAFTGAASAEDVFTPEQKAAIQAILEERLNEKPEIIIQAVDNFRAKQEQEAQKQASQNITKHLDWMTSADAPSTGAADADVTVVEFFDYNCGYCKRAVPDIQNLLKSDKKLRVVFHEMPILSETSRMAAQWALAAHKQGKYFDYHVALMNHQGPQSDETLEKIATDLGLDVKKMKEDANSAEIAAQIDKSTEVAREIGINGTPAFIVNGELYPGYLGEDGLKQSIEKARSGKKEG